MIACRIYQKIISTKAEADAGPPGWMQEHLRDCAVCREYYENSKRLVCQLLAGAVDQRQTPSRFLHPKIMNAVRSHGEMQLQPARGVLAWAMVAGAACLIAAAAIWWRQSPVADSSASVPARTEPTTNVYLPTVAQVDQWTKDLDSPLERETQLVLSDANDALTSLARNFLPEDLLQPAHQ